MLVKSLKQTGQINMREGYTMDYDNQVNSNNGTNYSSEVFNGFSTSMGLTATFFKNNMYFFYRGRSTDDLLGAKSNNGVNWSAVPINSASNTDGTPECVVFKGKIYVFFQGTSSHRIYYTSSSDGSSWSTDIGLDAETGEGHAKNWDLQGAMSTLVFNDKLYLYYPASNSGGTIYKNLNVAWTSDGSTWNYNTIYTSNALDYNDYIRKVNVERFNNSIFYFVADGTGTTRYYISSSPTSFSNTTPYSLTAINDGVKGYSVPRTMIYNGRMYIYYVDDSQLLRFTYTTNGINWNQSYTQINAGSGHQIDVLAIPTKTLNAQNVTAQSTYPYSGYSPWNIIDGDITTTVGGQFSWTNGDIYSIDGKLPQWVEIDFGSTVTFGRLNFYTSDNYEIRDYEVHYNLNGTWYPLLNITNNTYSFKRHDFIVRNARYLRIICKNGPSIQPQYARLNEIEIY